MKVHNTSHRQSIKSLNVNTALQRTFEMSKHIVVYEVLAALRKAPPPDPNATPQQYENALKDLEGKWEEELEKNAEFSDIEAFAKSKEALDQILKVDLSKLDSAEMRALNDAFGKLLRNISPSTKFWRLYEKLLLQIPMQHPSNMKMHSKI